MPPLGPFSADSFAHTFVPAIQLFRFESFWLRHPAISQVIYHAWTSPLSCSDPTARFTSKLERVQLALRSWAKGLISALNVQAALCLSWIEWLDRAEEIRILTPAEFNLRLLLKNRYEELCLQEEMRWKQRSGVHWLRVGDANTKFFHLKASCRFDTPSCATVDFSLLYGDEAFDLSTLLSPFTVDEVKRAVFSCAPEKAPGPDGFPMLFYQRFWPFLREDIMEVFKSFYNGSSDLADANTSWICPIPKKNDVATAKDLRPISLIHSLPKLISKVLATRLQRFMNLLINPFQTAFVKGRYILDNFLTAHILTHHLLSSKQQAALFKIDFDRAFDHINWHFSLSS
uniref:Reverse transcriptase domain-containing protein n=1 Tax=Ananas comosus var. bracteatus TaxID=296719 RepID=A0A6V7PE96_ANACO|nr:unnamed protein product [Ananas comosus var. bracteatus]